MRAKALPIARAPERTTMNSSEIEIAAAAWFAKREAGGWTAEHQSELDAWLAQSTAHRIAFLRVCEAWKRFGELAALTGDRAPGTAPERGTWTRSLSQENVVPSLPSKGTATIETDLPPSRPDLPPP